MGIKEKDIKLLWGRAANRCLFPDCRMKLSQDKKTATETFPIGEQAHIVGKEKGSARSDSSLSMVERDSYHNLILLCPNHHTIIDKNPADYPIEILHMMKSQHEYWVESTLSESYDSKKAASDVIYAHLIDMAVEGCYFDNLENWISGLNMPAHRVKIDVYEKVMQLTIKMYKAIFPGNLIELESAMKLFSTTMNIMLNLYIKNAESTKEEYVEDRSYKRTWHEEEIFRKFADRRDRWERCLDELIREVVKAANWFADIVRRDINPVFMATQGKFSLVYGPDEYLSFQTIIPEYSHDEKRQLIDSYKEKCATLKKMADSVDV